MTPNTNGTDGPICANDQPEGWPQLRPEEWYGVEKIQKRHEPLEGTQTTARRSSRPRENRIGNNIWWRV